MQRQQHQAKNKRRLQHKLSKNFSEILWVILSGGLIVTVMVVASVTLSGTHRNSGRSFLWIIMLDIASKAKKGTVFQHGLTLLLQGSMAPMIRNDLLHLLHLERLTREKLRREETTISLTRGCVPMLEERAWLHGALSKEHSRDRSNRSCKTYMYMQLLAAAGSLAAMRCVTRAWPRSTRPRRVRLI
jgi:hypothetical protein